MNRHCIKQFVPLVFVLLMTTATVRGQGRVTFSSAGPGVNAKFEAWGIPLTATYPSFQYRADLFWAPGNTTVGVLPSNLTNQCNFNQSFSTSASQAGYFTGGTKTVPGWVSGPIVAQVRVWDTTWPYDVRGLSLASVSAESAMFVITPTVSPTSAPYLVGLGNGVVYALQPVEPIDYPSPRGLTNLLSQKVAAGDSAYFIGGAYAQLPFNYQWYFNQAPIPGRTNSSLIVTNVGPTNVGSYKFVAWNQYGSATSSVASLEAHTILSVSSGPTIQMKGAIGYPFRLEYRDALGNGTNWTELTTITLTNTIQSYLDSTFNGQQQRFYRGIQLP